MLAEQDATRGSSGAGVVLASFGRAALVRANGRVFSCTLGGRKHRPVCGDRIAWEHAAAAEGPTVCAVQPRRNLIERIDARGRAEPVAANLDRLAIVVAPHPSPDWFLVDRYWAGALQTDIDTVLLWNKSDLDGEAAAPALEEYARLGLRILQLSAAQGAGIAELGALLRGAVTLIVGQSGVGKSSLVNALSPSAAARTAQLTREIEGRHTTTTARCYDLDDATSVIDAPGVRDFAPPAHLLRAAQHGFLEVQAQSAACRFKDCRHLQEPHCAVREAVSVGAISARRYESYRRLFRLYEKLRP